MLATSGGLAKSIEAESIASLAHANTGHILVHEAYGSALTLDELSDHYHFQNQNHQKSSKDKAI
jgi:hypothetical protein